MADSTQSDADKIRAKRLAKLQNQAPSPKPDSKGQPEKASERLEETRAPATASDVLSSTSASQAPPIGTIIITPASDSPSVNPFVKPGRAVAERETNVKRIRITSTSVASQESALGTDDDGLKSIRRIRTPAGLEFSDVWEDKILSAIFRLTLDPETLQAGSGYALHYVAGVREDLLEQGSPVKLSLVQLEQAMLEAASNLEGMTPLRYLLGCWKRVSRQLRSFKGYSQNDPKISVLKEARRICFSYCIFAATMPDMFGQDPTDSNPLLVHLLVDSEDDVGICHDFLTEAIARFVEDDSVKEILVDAYEQLSDRLALLTMSDDYKPYVMAARTMVRFPSLVSAIAASPKFLPSAIEAEHIQDRTFLGPFFQISPLQGEVTLQYFSSPKSRDNSYIINSQKALRMSLETHQMDLLDIVNHIIRASKESRDQLLDWFALTVNANHKRRALQVDSSTVSSDGFMVNVTVCLDQLCDPFMDSTFSKIDRIDVDYLRREPRVSIKDETKLMADQQASDAFYATAAEGTSNFISEIFFLTLAAHHYGTEATITKLGQLEKDLKHMEKQIVWFEAERSKWVNTPQYPTFEAALKKYQLAIDKGLSYKYAVQGVLFDDLGQARSMQFMRYVIVWLLRLVVPEHDYPRTPLKLPLAEQEPEVFRCLPEYFLEDVVANYKFVFANLPHIITSTQCDELIVLCITFLRSSEYIKNPYLKSGLVSILYRGIWPQYGRTKGILGDLLCSHPFATEHLLHALMKFYIEVETTGMHNQFYDKFNIRYEIFQVIKCIWTNPTYRQNLSTESRVNVSFFVRFVNLLLNDVTFVLDESLTAFHKIHALQLALGPAHLASLTNEERQEKEEALTEAESRARSYMQLTNSTVAMLKLFTSALAAAFTMPEIVQRLADMLDYNLDVMVGAKSSELKVRDPDSYGFDPKHLLSELIDVYLHLGKRDAFVLAVARDGRSYKPENLETATVLLRRYALKTPEEIAGWVTLAHRFQIAKQEDEQAEQDLGEIPDDFLDPLMFSLMLDPVILPKSGVTIDRSTIQSHLLSDPNDPFNRAPLRIEDIRDDIEMRERIAKWRHDRMEEKHKEGVSQLTAASAAVTNPQQPDDMEEEQEQPQGAMETSGG